MPAIASILFYDETYRVAFDLDLEEDFDAVLDDFRAVWCADAEELCGDFVDAVLEELRVVFFFEDDDTRDCEPFFVDLLLCARPLGASFTGSATRNTCPGRIVLEERRFQRRRSSTEIPKRSATVTSVSPRRVV